MVGREMSTRSLAAPGVVDRLAQHDAEHAEHAERARYAEPRAHRRERRRAAVSWRLGALFAGVLTLTAVGHSVLGCSGRPGASTASRPLPAHAGRFADLFDDAIEPAAVGLDFDKSYSARADALLRERVHAADAAVRVKVATVTIRKDGPETSYQLGLHTLEGVAGKHPPPTDFTVDVTKASESHGIMKSFETRLVGFTFIAFVRQFVRPDGDRELHFHLAPDSKEVRTAISNSLVLGELNQP